MAPALAQIGMTQAVSGDLPITIIYPTDEKGREHAFGPFELDVALNAAASRGNGRLIVISHGAGGDAYTLHTLARTLALAGFVVAQPEHQGDNRRDQTDSGIVSWKRRPSEVSHAIDAIAANPRFSGALHLDHVGVYGVSAGGGTGLALAGADWSMATLRQHCTAHIRDDEGFCLYGTRTAQERAERAKSYSDPMPARGAELLGSSSVRDSRVSVVAVSVPVGAIFTQESLAAIRMPVGVIEAQADKVLNPKYHSGYVLANCHACIRLDSVLGGGHFDTLSPWPEVIAKAAAMSPGAQRNPEVDDARRQESYDRIASFFRDRLVR